MSGDALVTIQANVREGRGKGYARRLRRAGKIPGNLLEKGKSTPIELDPKFLSKAWLGGKTFNLELGGQSRKVFIKELQLEPVKRLPLHVDLVYA